MQGTMKAEIIQQSPQTIVLQESDMTLPSGITLYGTDANVLYKFGRLCILTFSIKMHVSANQGYKILNYMPVGSRPTRTLTFTGDDSLGDGNAQSANLSSDGGFTVWPVNLNKDTYCVGTAVYIC